MSTTSAVGVRPSQDSEKGKTHDSQGGLGLWAPVAIVAVAGLAWATGLRWGRIICGVMALIPIPIWVLTVGDFGGPDLASTTRGAWTALYFWSYLAVLALGCAIRLRRTA